MPTSSRQTGKVNRRSDILKAAETLLRSRGLSGVTTRQIAQTAGCSEAALYVHFQGRLELLLAVLEEGLPALLRPLQDLKQSLGQATPQENLLRALEGIFKFHHSVVPITAALFAEPELLAAYRTSLKRQGKGPHLSLKALEEYILAEQRLGRIDSQVDAKIAAGLIMSSSFFRSFVEQFFGTQMQPTWSKFAKQLIETIVPNPAANRRS